MRMTLFFALAGTMLVCACGSGTSSTPTTPTTTNQTTTFQGIVATSGFQSGTLSVTIQSQVTLVAERRWWEVFVATLHAQATTVTATGTLRFAASSAISLTGTFDASTKRVALSGGGYTFTGTITAGAIMGSFTGPSIAGGGFSANSTTAGGVTMYCGTVIQTSGHELMGVFNIAVSASGAVTGAYCVRPENAGGGSPCGQITGQVTGTTIVLTHGDSTSNGTIQGGTVSGVSNDAGRNTYSGTTAACQ